jgi:ABC-type transporter Mla subunit MlaD
MNIFNPLVSGSLSVSGSGQVSGDLTVLGTLFATISGTAQNAISTSHAASYLLTSSFEDRTGSFATTGSNYFKGEQTFSGSLIPSGSELFDLGSSTNRWRDIFLAGSTINLGGTKLTKDGSGNIEIKDSNNNLKNVIASEVQIGEGDNAIIIKRDPSTGYFRLAGQTQPYIAAQLSGSFTGSGAGLYDIPASGVTGLNLNQISDGSATASISQADGLRVNIDSEFTGSVKITGSIYLNGNPIGTGKLDETTFNSYTSSNDNRLGSIEISTGSLNTFSSSTNDSLISLETASGSIRNDFNTYTSSNYLANSAQNNKISAIETTTSSLNTFSASINSAIETTGSNLTIKGDLLVKGTTTQIDSTTLNIGDNIIQLNGAATNNAGIVVQDASGASIISGSLLWDTATDYWKAGKLGSEERIILNNEYNTFSTSIDSRASSLENSKSSLNSYTSSNDTRLGIIETTTGSLNSYTSSTNTRLNVIEGTTSSLNTYTSSTNERLNSIETASGSIRTDFNSYTSSNNTKLNSIETSTGSLNSYTSSNNTRLDGIETTTGSLNSYTSSNTTNINAIHTATSSLNSFTNSIDTTIKNKLNNDGVISGSVQVNITQTTGYSTFSGSIATTDATQNDRIAALESVTGSYATTGSSNIVGNQTITGSVYITQNLTVLGTSSFLFLTASQLAVSSSTISVNVFEPAERFGGLKVYDSGSESHQATASLLWDSQNNKWIYQNASAGGYSGGMLISGPRNTGSLGEEVGTIANVVMKGQGGDHITGSNITDDGSNVRVNSNTVITGSLIVTSTVSGTNITAIEATTASLNSFTSSAASRLTAIETSTSSLNAFTSSTNTRLGLIETSTGSLNSYTTSNNSRLNTIESATSSLNSYTSSTNTRLSSIETSTGSLNTFSSSANSKLTSIESTTSSLNSYTSSNTTNINAIHTATSSLNSFSSSANSRLGSIESSTSSLNTFTNSFNSAFSLSGADVTVRGNFTVSGTTTTVNSTTVAIGDNIIQLNGSGATNAGIVVRDATSPTTTSGSLLWDTTGDKWIAGPLGSEDDIVLRTTAQTLTNKTINASQLVDGSVSNAKLANSSITIAGTSTALGATISAATILSGTGVVSGSAQLTSSFVQKGGDTMTGQLIVGSTGTGNSPTLRINNSSASSFNHSIEALAANTTAGQTNLIVLGVSGSTKNAGYLGYNWASAASNSNYVSLGHWGADNLLRVYGDGTVYMGTVTTGVWNGTAIGDSYISSATNWNTAYSKRPSSLGFTSSTVTLTLGDSSTITASVPTFNQNTTGNAATVTNGVYTTGDQTIGGTKTFSGNILMSAGYISGYVGSTGSGDSYAPFRFSQDYSGWLSLAAGTPGSNNGWGLFWAGNSGAQYGTNGTGGPGNIWSNSTNPNEYVFVGNGSTNMAIHGNTGNVWIAGNLNVAGGTITATTFSGNATSATTADQIDGVGFRNTGNNSPVAANTLDSNGMTYVTDVDGSSSNLTGNSTDGALYSQIYSSSWQHQIYGDYRTGIMYARGKNNGTWQSWKRVAMSNSTTFSNVSSVSFTHNLGTANLTAQVFDTNGDMFFPSNIRISSTQVIVTFASSRSGRLVVTG